MDNNLFRKYIRELIQQELNEDELDEASTTATAGGEYDTPFAFVRKGGKKRKKSGYDGGHKKPDVSGYTVTEDPKLRGRSGLKGKQYLPEGKKIGKYDIGMGTMGNGTVVWNKNQEENGDYKKIAYILYNNDIQWFDKKMPSAVKKYIQQQAKKLWPESVVNEGKVTLSQIKKEFDRFDYSYTMSDDHRYWKSGKYNATRIKSLIQDYLKDHPNDKKKITLLSYKAYPYRHPFNHKFWVTESVNERVSSNILAADRHKHKIAVDTVKNPLKGRFLGGPTEKEAIKILKRDFGYTDKEIKKLQKESMNEAKANGHEVELFWTGLSGPGSKIGKFVVSPRNYNRLEDEFTGDIDFDLYTDDSTEKQVPYQKVLKAIKNTKYGKIAFKKESVNERVTTKTVYKWFKSLPENKWRKTYNIDTRRITHFVNEGDEENMPESLRRRGENVSYERERKYAHKYLEYMEGLREMIRDRIKEELLKEISGESHELKVFIDDNPKLQRQIANKIYKNLTKKKEQGKYNKALAQKAYLFLVAAGAQEYVKEYGGSIGDIFPKKIQKELASEYVEKFEREG